MVVTPTLEGCTEKWARGSAILDTVVKRVVEYLEDGPPHRVQGAFDAASCTYVVTGEIVRPMSDPLMLAVLLGDAVHNLRSALDHLIWQLVLLNTGKPVAGKRGRQCVSEGAVRTRKPSSPAATCSPVAREYWRSTVR